MRIGKLISCPHAFDYIVLRVKLDLTSFENLTTAQDVYTLNNYSFLNIFVHKL